LTNPKINHKLPETLRPTQTEIGRRSSTQYLLGHFRVFGFDQAGLAGDDFDDSDFDE
jgi:hypothetical protein